MNENERATSGPAVGSVVRRMRAGDWRLVQDDEVTASAHAVFRPDGRCYLSVDAWAESAYDPLVAAVAADVRVPLHVRVDAADALDLQPWRSLGFRPYRREIDLVLSVPTALQQLRRAVLPAGIVLLGADAVDIHALRRLDDELRQDIPGTDGWRSDPDDFRDHTFDAWFDSSTYLVAVDDVEQRFAGLVRIWLNERRARLGMVGVTRAYRRRGLARAMLQAALSAVQDRGPTTVVGEADETNAASLGLLRALGATATGTTVELRRAVRELFL